MPNTIINGKVYKQKTLKNGDILLEKQKSNGAGGGVFIILLALAFLVKFLISYWLIISIISVAVIGLVYVINKANKQEDFKVGAIVSLVILLVLGGYGLYQRGGSSDNTPVAVVTPTQATETSSPTVPVKAPFEAVEAPAQAIETSAPIVAQIETPTPKVETHSPTAPQVEAPAQKVDTPASSDAQGEPTTQRIETHSPPTPVETPNQVVDRQLNNVNKAIEIGKNIKSFF